MQNQKTCVLAFCFSMAILLVTAGAYSQARLPPTLRTPDVVYVATPPEVVEAMLKMADARKGDVLYDLGSGDGRIPIAAVILLFAGRKYSTHRSDCHFFSPAVQLTTTVTGAADAACGTEMMRNRWPSGDTS